jgi:hypothetical protein
MMAEVVVVATASWLVLFQEIALAASRVTLPCFVLFTTPFNLDFPVVLKQHILGGRIGTRKHLLQASKRKHKSGEDDNEQASAKKKI